MKIWGAILVAILAAPQEEEFNQFLRDDMTTVTEKPAPVVPPEPEVAVEEPEITEEEPEEDLVPPEVDEGEPTVSVWQARAQAKANAMAAAGRLRHSGWGIGLAGGFEGIGCGSSPQCATCVPRGNPPLVADAAAWSDRTNMWYRVRGWGHGGGLVTGQDASRGDYGYARGGGRRLRLFGWFRRRR